MSAHKIPADADPEELLALTLKWQDIAETQGGDDTEVDPPTARIIMALAREAAEARGRVSDFILKTPIGPSTFLTGLRDYTAAARKNGVSRSAMEAALLAVVEEVAAAKRGRK